MAGVGHAVRSVAGAPARLWRGAARGSPRAIGGWAAILAVLIAVVAVMLGQVQAQASDEGAGQDALKAANDSVGKVLGYSHNTIDDDVANARTLLTGKFAEDYGQLTQSLIVPTAKRDEITSEVRVVSSSVVSAASDKVTALLFVNQTARSKALAQPKVDGSRVRLTLEKVDDRWLISELTPV